MSIHVVARKSVAVQPDEEVIAAAMAAAPFAEQSLRLISLREPASVERLGVVESDDDGHFLLALGRALSREEFVIAVAEDARGGLGESCVPVASATRELDVGSLELERPSALTVRVRANGAALRGAEVVAQATVIVPSFEAGHLVEVPLPLSARTDAAGLARLALRAGGRGSVAVSSPGLATETLSVDLEPGETSLDVDLLPAASVEGSVIDATGAGRAGATVSAYLAGRDGEELELPAARAQSDAQGHFLLGTLAAGRDYVVAAEPRERDLACAAVEVRAPCGRVAIRLPRACGLEVALGGAEALLELHALDDTSGRWTLVDGGPAGGSDAWLRRLEPGTYRVLAHAPGRAAALSEPMRLDEGSTRSVALTLSEGRVVSGRVVAKSGEPVAGARVWWSAASCSDFACITDAAGRFDFHDLPATDVRLEAGLGGRRGAALARAGISSVGDVSISD